VRARRQPEQDAGLAQQRAAVGLGAHGPHLQRDGAVVHVVERLYDSALPAGADHLELLVPAPQQLRHVVPFDETIVGAHDSLRSSVVDHATVEIWALDGVRRVELAGGRMTVGKGTGNDIVLDDPTVSRLHASLEKFAEGWCVTDLGSSNGTYLNGERIWAQQRLRHGDEMRVGRSRLLFRSSEDAAASRTETEGAPPALTARERDVLVVLCRPLLARDLFTEPTSIKEIAAQLVVSEAAVKQHMVNLYDKFEVGDDLTHRRTRLANEAIRRGAVTLSDLRHGETP